MLDSLIVSLSSFLILLMLYGVTRSIYRATAVFNTSQLGSAAGADEANAHDAPSNNNVLTSSSLEDNEDEMIELHPEAERMTSATSEAVPNYTVNWDTVLLWAITLKDLPPKAQ